MAGIYAAPLWLAPVNWKTQFVAPLCGATWLVPTISTNESALIGQWLRSAPRDRPVACQDLLIVSPTFIIRINITGIISGLSLISLPGLTSVDFQLFFSLSSLFSLSFFLQFSLLFLWLCFVCWFLGFRPLKDLTNSSIPFCLAPRFNWLPLWSFLRTEQVESLSANSLYIYLRNCYPYTRINWIAPGQWRTLILPQGLVR